MDNHSHKVEIKLIVENIYFYCYFLQPGGGDKRIENRKLEWSAESKIKSTKNLTHKAGGGNVKVNGYY